MRTSSHHLITFGRLILDVSILKELKEDKDKDGNVRNDKDGNRNDKDGLIGRVNDLYIASEPNLMRSMCEQLDWFGHLDVNSWGKLGMDPQPDLGGQELLAHGLQCTRVWMLQCRFVRRNVCPFG